MSILYNEHSRPSRTARFATAGSNGWRFRWRGPRSASRRRRSSRHRCSWVRSCVTLARLRRAGSSRRSAARSRWTVTACSCGYLSNRDNRRSFSSRPNGRAEGQALLRPFFKARMTRPVSSVLSAQQPRQPSVLEDPAARLAGRAVVDRVLLEVDLRDRCAAGVAGLAEMPVHAVDTLVAKAALPQLEPPAKLGVDRFGKPRELLEVELIRKRVGRELRRAQDLVCPRAADSRERALVAQERMQPPRVVPADLAELLGRQPQRVGAEVLELGLGVLGTQ